MIINDSSVIEINRKALENNINFIRNLISPGVIFSSVVKGNAYGHGIEQMIPELNKLGVDHFSVFSSFEARTVHAVADSNSNIMIMGDISGADLSWVIENEIECFVFNSDMLNRLVHVAQSLQKKAIIHIELETGMNRHGFREETWETICQTILQQQEFLQFKGICTHYAGAESSANYKRVMMQQKNFEKGIAFFREKGLKPERIHSSCSAAALAYPELNYDMVRIGIIQYGLWPSKEMELTYKIRTQTWKSPLDTVISWKSRSHGSERR